MSTKAALGASGASLVLSLINARGLSSLSEDVEKMKASMSSTPASNVPVEATGNESIFEIGDDLDTIKNDTSALDNAISRIDALEKVSANLTGVPNQVTTLEGEMEEMSKEFKELDTDIQGTLFDIENIVDLAPEIQELVTGWGSMNTKAGINDNGMFQAEDANIALKSNSGDTSAYRFTGVSSNSWAMYLANPSGKTPGGNTPPTHGKVTSNAIRMSIGANTSQGFIVENGSNDGVFSVNGYGDTLMGQTYCGTLNEDMGGVAHSSNFNTTDYALMQTKEGATSINASNERDIGLGNNGEWKVLVPGTPTTSLVIKNSDDSYNTKLNHNGQNIFVADEGKYHLFRFGENSTNVVSIQDWGLKIDGTLNLDGTNLNASITSLHTKVNDLITRVNALE